MSLRPLQQSRQERLDHVDGAHQVHVEHPLDRGVVEVGHGHERLDDAGVVEQAVHTPVGLFHLRDERLHGYSVGDVHDMQGQPVPGVGEFGGLLQGLGAHVHRRHPRAPVQGLEHEFATHAAAAACDDPRCAVDSHDDLPRIRLRPSWAMPSGQRLGLRRQWSACVG